MSSVQIDGADIAYIDDEKDGDVIVLAHGFLLSSRSMRDAAACFPDHRTVCIDLRGFGGSVGADDGFTLERWAQDICDVTSHIGIDRFTLVAHSMSGAIALRLAMDRPEVLDAVVMVGGVPAHGAAGNAEGQALMDQVLAMCGNAPMLRAMLDSFRVGEIPEQVFDDMVTDAALVRESAFAAWLTRESHRNQEDGLDGIDVPFCFLAFGKDIAIGVEHHLRTSLRIRRARTVILNEEGHLFPQESPQRFAREVLAFLATLDDRSRTGR